MVYGSMDKYVTVEGINVFETPEAVCGDFGTDESIWIPKSQMEDWPDLGDFGEWIIQEWIAIEKGIV